MRLALRRSTLAAAAAAALVVQGLSAAPASANAVVGYISITMSVGMTSPNVVIAGVLATPAWSCSQSVWNNPVGAAFEVTCTQVNSVQWMCSVLHANSATFNAGAVMRTQMFCDGSDVPAAQTKITQGAGDRDVRWAPANIPVQRVFRCRIDNGLGSIPVPSFNGFCGDPPSLI